MIIPFFSIDPTVESEREAIFSRLEAQRIECCNWKEFTYTPKVSLWIFHTGEAVVLRFKVEEEVTKAEVEIDNGAVWTDSCCEIFFRFQDEEQYYNLETTCAGRALLGYRKDRFSAEHASVQTMNSILRFPSLGDECFAERHEGPWTLDLVIPAKAFFHSHLERFDGIRFSFNAYKCGDSLSKPHYLSLFPIKTPKPDFHRPEFFREACFEAREMRKG